MIERTKNFLLADIDSIRAQAERTNPSLNVLQIKLLTLQHYIRDLNNQVSDKVMIELELLQRNLLVCCTNRGITQVDRDVLVRSCHELKGIVRTI